MAQSLLVSWDRAAPVSPSIPDRAAHLAGRDTCCLGCTGFIANRSELLQCSGLPSTASDSDLLLQLYAKHGSGVAQHIAGPFAWIVWDGQRQALVAVRDRLGTQGLYYVVRGQTVIVASRVERLLETSPTRVAFNPRSIVAQINWQVPLAGESFYEGIHAVEPGALVTVTRETVRAAHYWQVKPLPVPRLASDDEYVTAFRKLLFRVAAEHLPQPPDGVALALSGGMDSTTVGAALKAVAPDSVVTAFTQTAPDLPESDEGPTAVSVCQQLNVALVTIRSDQHWPLSAPGGITTSRATPFYNVFTDVWMACFREMNRRRMRVVFSGAGGDHLFGGQVCCYPDLLLAGRWRDLARQVRRHQRQSELSLTQVIRGRLPGPILRAYVPLWPAVAEHPVPWLHPQYHDWYKKTFRHSEWSWRTLPGRARRLRELQDRSLRYGVEQTHLQAADHGLEFRRPLLDHRLFEFAAALPSRQTYEAGQKKIIMRRAMRGYLPDDLLDRPYNIYSHAIVNRGLRDREHAKVWNLITGMRAAELGFVNEARLQEAYRSYLAGEPRRHNFWHTLALEDWLRRYS